MEKKETGLLKKTRKELNISTKELDKFITAKTKATKYYLEDSYGRNKVFRYLLFLRLKGLSLDDFFDKYIRNNNIKIKENE